jgi:hypothetical protein
MGDVGSVEVANQCPTVLDDTVHAKDHLLPTNLVNPRLWYTSCTRFVRSPYLNGFTALVLRDKRFEKG